MARNICDDNAVANLMQISRTHIEVGSHFLILFLSSHYYSTFILFAFPLCALAS